MAARSLNDGQRLYTSPSLPPPICHLAGRPAAHVAALGRLRMNTRRAGGGATGSGTGAAAGSGADAADLRPSPRLVAMAERAAA